MSKRRLTRAHESLSLSALLATLAHVVLLVFDDYVSFGAVDILVPGASAWRPVAVGLGIGAAYTSVVVAVSFYLRRWIGQRTWRALHFASFGVFMSALAHGVTAGTDTRHPAVIVLYGASAVVVVGLVVLRIILSGTKSRSAAASRPAVGAR